MRKIAERRIREGIEINIRHVKDRITEKKKIKKRDRRIYDTRKGENGWRKKTRNRKKKEN